MKVSFFFLSLFLYLLFRNFKTNSEYIGNSNECYSEYTDDHAVIPRSTSILARRLPPSKPGRGNGQIYMAAIEGNSGAPSGAKGYQNTNSGGGGGSGAGGSGWKAGSMSKRFDGREEQRVGGNGAGGDVKSSNQVRFIHVISFEGLVLFFEFLPNSISFSSFFFRNLSIFFSSNSFRVSVPSYSKNRNQVKLCYLLLQVEMKLVH